MTCEYFSRIGRRVFCRIYGKLKEANKEKALECESNFADCFQKANQTLVRNLSEDTYSRVYELNSMNVDTLIRHLFNF